MMRFFLNFILSYFVGRLQGQKADTKVREMNWTEMHDVKDTKKINKKEISIIKNNKIK